MAYSWIPFYRELSKELLQFRNDRKPLIDWIYSNIKSDYIKHLKDAPDGRHVADIDPFTVYAIFNRGITDEKRIEICAQFKSFLNISSPVPQDFDAIPIMNAKQSNFMAFADRRKEGDVERLWNVFELAVLDKNIEDAYNALSHQYLIKFNITFGLFWIRPDKYLPLDGHSQDLLASLKIKFDRRKFLPYNEYDRVMKELNEKIDFGSLGYSDYVGFSHAAYGEKYLKSTANKKQDDSQSYWMYSPGEQAVFWDEYYQNGIMGLGWNKIGDLKDYKKQEDLIAPLKKNYGEDNSQVKNANMLYDFAYNMKPGDIVFAKKGRSIIVGRGVVTSDYYFDGDHKIHPHLRKINWTDKGVWEVDSLLAMKTLTNITRMSDHVSYLNNLIDGNSISKVEEPIDSPASDNYWWLVGNPKIWSISRMKVGEEQNYTMYSETGHPRRIFQNFVNAKVGDMVIGYESSPTKKIVSLLTITKVCEGDCIYFKKTQSLKDPIDLSTIRSIPGLMNMEYIRNQQGSFFRLTADEYDIIMDLVRGDNPIQKHEKIEKYDKSNFLNDVYISDRRYDALENLLLRKKNLILQGAPGVGKTFAAKRLAYAIMGEKDDNKVMQVQFHQNYSYEDFVMGYKPNDEGGFEMKSGIFYRFCKHAAADREHKYFFIIDEINRGNLSKIFGELLMLIENDYRDKPILLAYKDELFAVPSNVYIIGMMNTADRSLAMIDYALRRRFSFFEMSPGFDAPSFMKYLQEKNDPKLESLISAIIKLNEIITDDDSLGSGFCIGHSYLCNLGSDYDLSSIVEYDIIPMLREYWFDNNDRFNEQAQALRNALSK